MDTPEKTPTPFKPTKKKKRSIWFHLHFWTGWIFAIPIFLVCLTGALAIFEQDMRQWEKKEFYTLEPTGEGMTIAEALDAYKNGEPSYQVNHLGVPKSPKHAFSAYAVEINPDGSRGKGASVYLNPYTGELTPMTDSFSITSLIIDIHRHLVAGKTGQMIVGISSVVLAITCIFGVILWLPFRGRTFARAIKRGNALDWHNALGLIAIGPLIVMALTGILFTWGQTIWPFLEKFQSQPAEIKPPAVVVPENPERVSVDLVIQSVEEKHPNHTITGIQPSNWPKNGHSIFISPENNKGKELRLVYDPYTGEELMVIDKSKAKGAVGWLRNNFGKIHTFGSYGKVLQYLWGFLSLVGSILVATGMWVSIKRWRRPKRRTA